MTALDDTQRDLPNTIAKKYGGAAKALHGQVRQLTKEILARLKIPVVEAGDVDTAEDVNAEVTRAYQTA
jgi:hypothetical protein